MRSLLWGLPISFLLLAAGCSPTIGWRKRDLPPAPNPNTEIEIWSHGTVVRLHAVAVTRDSVAGIPHRMSARCHGCRRSLVRSDVDSIRLHYVSPAVTALVAVLGAQALFFEATGTCFFVIKNCGRP